MNKNVIDRLIHQGLYIAAMIGILSLFAAKANEVYNFYFQKGAAPNTVIQGGGGQSSGSTTTPVDPHVSENENKNSEDQPLSDVKHDKSVGAQVIANSNVKVRDYSPYTISFGYGALKDPVGTDPAFKVGFNYNFNKYLGVKVQGRLRDLNRSKKEAASRSSANTTANRLSGLAALNFTPLRIELLGHRLLELSAFGGAESYRRNQSSAGKNRIGVSPIIGASALFAMNPNFGIELQGGVSTKGNHMGVNLAFQF